LSDRDVPKSAELFLKEVGADTLDVDEKKSLERAKYLIMAFSRVSAYKEKTRETTSTDSSENFVSDQTQDESNS
jgi:hypothetical protein